MRPTVLGGTAMAFVHDFSWLSCKVTERLDAVTMSRR